MLVTSTWMTPQLVASTLALDVSVSTIAFSFPTTSAISSTLAFFTSALTRAIVTSSSKAPTVDALSRSFCKPSERRSMARADDARFSPRKRVKSCSSDRYDLGNVYASRPSLERNVTATWFTLSKLNGMNCRTAFVVTSSPRSVPSRNWIPTLYSASTGHGWNQSITVQLTRAGKRVQRTRKSSLTGEKHRQTWRFLRTSPIK